MLSAQDLPGIRLPLYSHMRTVPSVSVGGVTGHPLLKDVPVLLILTLFCLIPFTCALYILIVTLWAVALCCAYFHSALPQSCCSRALLDGGLDGR